jgi:hypothetical protein
LVDPVFVRELDINTGSNRILGNVLTSLDTTVAFSLGPS